MLQAGRGAADSIETSNQKLTKKHGNSTGLLSLMAVAVAVVAMAVCVAVAVLAVVAVVRRQQRWGEPQMGYNPSIKHEPGQIGPNHTFVYIIGAPFSGTTALMGLFMTSPAVGTGSAHHLHSKPLLGAASSRITNESTANVAQLPPPYSHKVESH